MELNILAGKAKKIKLVATDIDGVWTDATMYYSPDGDYLKAFSTYDGMAVQLLREHGIQTAIITGEDSEIVRRRAEKLHIINVYTGEKNKLNRINELCRQQDITIDEVAYIGDDIFDSEALKAVGFSAMPSNSPILDRVKPDYVTKRPGGAGAFREFADLILQLKTTSE